MPKKIDPYFAFVDKVLTRLDPYIPYSEQAVTLLYYTGKVESKYRHLEQVGGGPALSWWQVEIDSCLDNLKTFIQFRSELVGGLVQASFIPREHWYRSDKDNWKYILYVNPAAALCHARVKYWRVPKPIPKTFEGMGKYWLEYYNAGGKGSMKKWKEIRE